MDALNGELRSHFNGKTGGDHQGEGDSAARQWRELNGVVFPFLLITDADKKRKSSSQGKGALHFSQSSLARSFFDPPPALEEVIALSPKSLLTPTKLICEFCDRTFVRDQNLRLHMKGHNIPYELMKNNPEMRATKKVYICPEIDCPRHDPAYAIRDITGIRKHFSRKHGEKTLTCDWCSRQYALLCDLKAHLKTCNTKSYRRDCSLQFDRKNELFLHRASYNENFHGDKGEVKETEAKSEASIDSFENHVSSGNNYSSIVHHSGEEFGSFVPPKLLPLLLNPNDVENGLSDISYALLATEVSKCSSSSKRPLEMISNSDTFGIPAFGASINAHPNLVTENSLGFEMGYKSPHNRQILHFMNGSTELKGNIVPSSSFQQLKSMVNFSESNNHINIPLSQNHKSISENTNYIMGIQGEKAMNFACPQELYSESMWGANSGAMPVDFLDTGEISLPMVCSEVQQNQKHPVKFSSGGAEGVMQDLFWQDSGAPNRENVGRSRETGKFLVDFPANDLVFQEMKTDHLGHYWSIDKREI